MYIDLNGASPEQERERIAKVLMEHGVTPTAQRLQIAALMFAQPQHFSADQVLAMVNEHDAVASKATVYNTLGLFAEKGLLRQVIVDPSRVFYDSNTGEHHHFYNLDSGSLTDVPADDIQLGALPRLPEGTVLDGVEVIVRVRSGHS